MPPTMTDHVSVSRRLRSPRLLLAAAFVVAASAQIAACESDAPVPPAPTEKPDPKPKASTTNTPTAGPQGSQGASPGAPASATSASPAGSGSAGAEAPKVDDTKWSTTTETKIDTSAGPVVIHAVHHGTVYLEVAKKVIWLDPFSEGKLDDKPKADFILVTDIHGDHLDEKALGVVKKPETKVMGPKAVADKLAGSAVVAKADFEVIANGEKKKLGPIEVEAIPMYNTSPDPKSGNTFHEKGRGNGYVITVGGKRLYFSGDTACTPEMKALTNIDDAFVCMNLPYTMTPEEAGECVAAFKPKVVTPYHHRGSDLTAFEKKLEGSGVKVEKLKFY